MTSSRVITKALAVEQDLQLGKGNVQQIRGGTIPLDLQSISISKVITDVSIFANNTTALDPLVSEYVDPNLHTTVLVEGYATLGDEGGGIFYWDPNVAPAAADGGHIFASGVITALGAWIRFVDDKIINVKHFGATGDGVTDDTAALLLAVTAVNTRLKAVLYFPEGIYNLDVSLDMTTAEMVVVRGDGIQNTIINHTGTTDPLFLFDTGAEIDEAAQFVVMTDFTMRTDQITETAIKITSTALVTDITRSVYLARLMFIGLTAADGWKFAIHTQDVRGVTVKDMYARHVSGSTGTIFFNVDNTLAFVSDDYTSFNNETHFYENDFGVITPTGGITIIDGANIIDGTVTIAKLADATPGDMITFDAAGVAILIGIGALGFVWTSNGPGLPASWQAAGGGGTASDNYLTGLTLSNDSDTAHDINVAIGQTTDSTNTVILNLISNITKRIDASWVVGDNSGGLFSGTVAANTTYHVFIIEKDSDDSIDIGFDTSLVAANIPAGYTEFRRIGSVITDSSANILQFLQIGDRFNLKDPVLDIDTSIGTSFVDFAMTTPAGIKLLGIFNIFMDRTFGVMGILVTDPDLGITSTPAQSIAPLSTMHAPGAFDQDGRSAQQVEVMTTTSSKIRSVGSATGTFRAATLGWIDTRGK